MLLLKEISELFILLMVKIFDKPKIIEMGR